jgi:uncharacterized membrane protein YdbT with pleckstrin-like domain
MSYIEENLMPGERVEYQAHVHWIVYLPAVALLLITIVFFILGAANEGASFVIGFGVFFLFAAAIGAAAAQVRKMSSEFAVTNRRVLIKVGLISRHTLELLLHKVEGIGVDQTLSGRLLGFGSIVVTGTGGTRERFDRIADPLEFRRHVQNHATPASQPPDYPSPSAAAPIAEPGPFCTRCGTRNAQDARFCNKCGQQIRA